jgi:hypothetical protein
MFEAEGLGSASNLIGYFGAAVVVFADFLTQRGLLKSDDWRFPATNLTGSVLVMVSLLYHLNPPSVLIEAFWSAISLYGIWRNLGLARATQVDPRH